VALAAVCGLLCNFMIISLQMIILYHVLEELEELDLHVDSKVCCEGAHPFVTFDPAKVRSN